ncbi:MAG: SPFH domain-containing protein [Lentisphaeria bacterium]
MAVQAEAQAKEATARRPAAMGCLAGGGVLALLLAMVVVAGPLWWWYGWRIEPEEGRFAVLIRKTGKDLPAGQVLALAPGQKGIQLAVLPEGRYFRNPYTWGWEYHPVRDIPAGSLGVLVRQYGAEPAAGEIIAREGTKGILPEILRPGKYRINPYAHEILVLTATQIRPGCVGVRTSLVGKDLLEGSQPPAGGRNGYLVGPGEKGVVAEVLDPGTHYLHPFMETVVEVNLQSQRFEMSGVGAITFLTQDGFPVSAEGTIEFNIEREKAALLTHQVGDLDDIINKIILPRARGFSRIEGSKKKAVDFIVGETRQEFQNNLEAHLKEKCRPWGVSVNSVLIRNIIPPQEIAAVIRNRELAAQEIRKYEQQITQARSAAELVRQEMLAEQSSKKVQAETAKLRAEIAARQDLAVRQAVAKRELEVATVGLETAKVTAASQLLTAAAEQEVIRKGNEAAAAVLATKVKAFGGGEGYVRALLYGRLGPRIQTILTSDQAGGVFGLPLPGTGERKMEVAK